MTAAQHWESRRRGMSHKELDEKGLLATEKYLDRRALIFIEEAIAHYIGRHGIKKTQEYLQYQLEYLEEFRTD